MSKTLKDHELLEIVDLRVHFYARVTADNSKVAVKTDEGEGTWRTAACKEV